MVFSNQSLSVVLSQFWLISKTKHICGELALKGPQDPSTEFNLICLN
jgi:hypothetical protein